MRSRFDAILFLLSIYLCLATLVLLVIKFELI